MRKRKAARCGYLLISLLFCLLAFVYLLLPTRSLTATCWFSGGILFAYDYLFSSVLITVIVLRSIPIQQE